MLSLWSRMLSLRFIFCTNYPAFLGIARESYAV